MRDDISNGNWNVVNSVSGTQQTVTDANYSTYQTTGSWRVETQWGITCTATIKNPNPMVNLNSSKSNVYKTGFVSVNSMDNDPEIIIYPNPTTGKFQVSGFKSQVLSLEIYNLLGEKIYSSTLNSKLATLNLSEAPSGIYFLHIKTPEGTSVKKIVKE